MPPPPNARLNINLINPKIIAIEHNTIPTTPLVLFSDFFELTNDIIPITNPIAAKGILSQLRVAKQGIKPIIIPTIESIPKIKLVICMRDNSFYLKVKNDFLLYNLHIENNNKDKIFNTKKRYK